MELYEAQQRAGTEMARLLVAIARDLGTGHIGSEHLAILAVEGAGGLAVLSGLPRERLVMALRAPCGLQDVPVERPTPTTRTQRLITTSLVIAEMRGHTVPTASDIVAALLNEPTTFAWQALAAVGVTPRSIERAMSR